MFAYFCDNNFGDIVWPRTVITPVRPSVQSKCGFLSTFCICLARAIGVRESNENFLLFQIELCLLCVAYFRQSTRRQGYDTVLRESWTRNLWFLPPERCLNSLKMCLLCIMKLGRCITPIMSSFFFSFLFRLRRPQVSFSVIDIQSYYEICVCRKACAIFYFMKVLASLKMAIL